MLPSCSLPCHTRSRGHWGMLLFIPPKMHGAKGRRSLLSAVGTACRREGPCVRRSPWAHSRPWRHGGGIVVFVLPGGRVCMRRQSVR